MTKTMLEKNVKYGLHSLQVSICLINFTKWHYFPILKNKYSYQLSAISYQLSVISYQLSVISYQLSAISYQLSAFGFYLITLLFLYVPSASLRAGFTFYVFSSLLYYFIFLLLHLTSLRFTSLRPPSGHVLRFTFLVFSSLLHYVLRFPYFIKRSCRFCRNF